MRQMAQKITPPQIPTHPAEHYHRGMERPAKGESDHLSLGTVMLYNSGNNLESTLQMTLVDFVLYF